MNHLLERLYLPRLRQQDCNKGSSKCELCLFKICPVHVFPTKEFHGPSWLPYIKIKYHLSNWHNEPERNENTGKITELLLQSAQDADWACHVQLMKPYLKHPQDFQLQPFILCTVSSFTSSKCCQFILNSKYNENFPIHSSHPFVLAITQLKTKEKPL